MQNRIQRNNELKIIQTATPFILGAIALNVFYSIIRFLG